jgi:hypothetical protein
MSMFALLISCNSNTAIETVADGSDLTGTNLSEENAQISQT